MTNEDMNGGMTSRHLRGRNGVPCVAIPGPVSEVTYWFLSHGIQNLRDVAP